MTETTNPIKMETLQKLGQQTCQRKTFHRSCNGSFRQVWQGQVALHVYKDFWGRLERHRLLLLKKVLNVLFYTGRDVEPRRHATARGVVHPASVQAEGRGPEAQARSGEVEQEAGLGEGEVLAPVRHHHHHRLCFCEFFNDLSQVRLHNAHRPFRGLDLHTSQQRNLTRTGVKIC